jgi:hypothetical protein
MQNGKNAVIDCVWDMNSPYEQQDELTSLVEEKQGRSLCIKNAKSGHHVNAS